MPRLFVYGTLQHEPLVTRLLGHATPAPRPAVLADHRAAPMAGRPYPGLVVETGATALGQVIEATDADVTVLDAFEGPEYERTSVVVTLTDDGATVSAHTYLLTGTSRALVRPGQWDLDRFVRGRAADWVGSAAAGDHHPDGGAPRGI